MICRIFSASKRRFYFENLFTCSRDIYQLAEETLTESEKGIKHRNQILYCIRYPKYRSL